MGKTKLQILREQNQAKLGAIKAKISLESAYNATFAYRRNPPTPPFPDLPKEILDAVVEMLQAGISPKEISNYTDLEVGVILEVVDALPRTQNYYDEKRKIVEKLLKTTNLSYAAIARKAKVPTLTIRRWARKYGWPERKGSYDAAFVEQVKRYCVENTDASYVEIAAFFGISDTTVRRWCKGLVEKAGPPETTAMQREKAMELCLTTKLSYEKIGNQVGVNGETVRKWCKAANIKRRSLKTYSAEAKDKVRELCILYNFNYKLLAKLTGIKIGNIRNWCRELKNQQEKTLGNKPQHRSRKLRRKRRSRRY
jgi:transposase